MGVEAALEEVFPPFMCTHVTKSVMLPTNCGIPAKIWGIKNRLGTDRPVKTHIKLYIHIMLIIFPSVSLA